MFLKFNFETEDIFSKKPYNADEIQLAVRRFHFFVYPCYGFEFITIYASAFFLCYMFLCYMFLLALRSRLNFIR